MPDRLALAVICASGRDAPGRDPRTAPRSDVDLDAGIIRIRRALVRVGGQFVSHTEIGGRVRDVRSRRTCSTGSATTSSHTPPPVITRCCSRRAADPARYLQPKRCTWTFTGPATKSAALTCAGTIPSFRRGARCGDRCIAGGTDGAVRPFDTASRDEISTRRPGT